MFDRKFGASKSLTFHILTVRPKFITFISTMIILKIAHIKKILFVGAIAQAHEKSVDRFKKT